MLIIALVLAVIGLAALVVAVVTSNELIAWVCIGASVIGVLLLIVDAVRERSGSADSDASDEEAEHDDATTAFETAEDYPDEAATEVHEAVEADTVAVSSDPTDDDADTTKHD
jgi:hypothetical protein